MRIHYEFMKRIVFFLILSSMISSSCNQPIFVATPSTISTTTETPTSIPVMESEISSVAAAKIVEILPEEYVELLGQYPLLISPDGEKVALKFPVFEINEQTWLSVPMISLTSTSKADSLDIQLDRTHTYYYFYSWAPDSTGFVGGFYDADKFSGGDYCCGEAIAITNLIEGEAKTSIYSWKWNYANRILWSDDSSMLSVTFFNDEYNTLIIDRHGKLIRTLNTGEKAAFWSKNILYYTTQSVGKVELRSLDLNTQESRLIIDDFGKFYYVAQNEKLNEILLTEVKSKEGNGYWAKNFFYALDLNTGTIKEIITPNTSMNRINAWRPSPSQDYVALNNTVYQEKDRLWILDWKTYEIKDYGEIEHLFGWYENIDGFLITSLDGKQRIIKP